MTTERYAIISGKCSLCEDTENVIVCDGEELCTECLVEQSCKREYNNYLLYQEAQQCQEEE